MTLCAANCLMQKLWFDLVSGRCMRSVRGPAPLCLDAFIPPNQIAPQALLEHNKICSQAKVTLETWPKSLNMEFVS